MEWRCGMNLEYHFMSSTEMFVVFLLFVYSLKYQ